MQSLIKDILSTREGKEEVIKEMTKMGHPKVESFLFTEMVAHNLFNKKIDYSSVNFESENAMEEVEHINEAIALENFKQEQEIQENYEQEQAFYNEGSEYQ